jgi:hypothetical protein
VDQHTACCLLHVPLRSFVLHVFHRYTCCGPCMPSALSL